MIYLDHNATSPLLPAARAAMLDALDAGWANPSSSHAPGQAARRLLMDARAAVAAFLGCAPAEVCFTSGATEANHVAVLGAIARSPGAKRLVFSAVEHGSMLKLAADLRTAGHVVDLIGVDREGRLDMDAARRLIQPDCALLSVMGANNETGVLMPLGELSELARVHGVPMHVDATQLAGRSEQRFATSGADLWSVSAHKLGGPKGVGALLQRRGLDWPALFAGRQERGRRGGTENLPGIAGFGAACAEVGGSLKSDLERIASLRARFEGGLRARVAGFHVYAAGAARLPNTTFARIDALDADMALRAIERAGVVAAPGAACGSGARQASHVLLAMGERAQLAMGAMRFSLGRGTEADEIDQAVAAIAAAIGAMRANLGTGPAALSA